MWFQQAVTGSGKVEKKILRILRAQFRLSFASQSFSIGVNIGGKLQWTGFASTYRNQQKERLTECCIKRLACKSWTLLLPFICALAAVQIFYF